MSYESPSMQDTRVDIGALLGAVVRRLPRIMLVTLALLVAAYVLLMFSPRLYESTASILVEPRGNIYTRGTNEQAPTLSGNEAGVVSSQIELIKSRDTLLRVIDRLDLRSVSEFNGSGDGGFSPLGVLSQILGRTSAPVSIDEIVLNNLYDAMTVSQARDSRIISVVVSSTDPQRAAEIANAVANAHVTRRAELSLSDTAAASGWLGTEIERLSVVVNDAETAVANFKVNNDLFIGSSNTSLPDQQMSTIASQISAAQERQNAAASRAALIRGMLERGQSIESVPDVRNSAVIQRLGDDKARLQGERAQRSATLLVNHPTIRALNAQIAELDNQIAIEGRRVADTLDAEAQIEVDLQVSLQANLSAAKTTASTATQDTVTLDSLEREAKAQRDLLEGYLQRYNEAFSRTETNSALPDVRVVSVAAPSVSPASPKVQLVLVAVGIVSVIVQIGIIAFAELMSGRAIVTMRQPERPQDELDEVPFLAEELEPDQRWEEPAVAAIAAEELPEPGFAEPVIVAPVVDVVETRSQDEMEIAIGKDFDASDAPVQSSHGQPIPVAPIEEDAGLTTMAELSSDLVYGRTHMLVLAAHSASADCEEAAEELIGEALSRGLSAALVDAGSGRIGAEPGLSDLSAGGASFGDVVQKSADNSFAEIAWGRLDAVSADSDKPLTLVQALSDIYEVVIVLTGEVGSSSTLPMFEGLDSRLVLVAGDSDDFGAVSACREQLRGLGYKHVDIAAVPARVAA